jgi:hypothetical protein
VTPGSSTPAEAPALTPRSYIADGSEHLIGVGALFSVSGPDDERSEVSGKLYVPDPEQRNGWREFYIHKPPVQKPGARPLGFRKP